MEARCNIKESTHPISRGRKKLLHASMIYAKLSVSIAPVSLNLTQTHQPPPRKHKPNLRILKRNPNTHRQRHGNPNPHRTPLQRPNNRFPTPMNRQRHPPPSIPMIPKRLLPPHEPPIEIRSRAENPSVACDDDAFHAVVDVEELEGVFELVHHGFGEGVVFARAVELEDDGWGDGLGGGGDVVKADLGEGERGVGGGEGEFGGFGGHGGWCGVVWKCV